MNELNCPICGPARLGAPYQFSGRWFAACSQCHAEIKLARSDALAGGAARYSLTTTMKLATLRATEWYRRRTSF